MVELKLEESGTATRIFTPGKELKVSDSSLSTYFQPSLYPIKYAKYDYFSFLQHNEFHVNIKL